jgi:hypothetical protein
METWADYQRPNTPLNPDEKFASRNATAIGSLQHACRLAIASLEKLKALVPNLKGLNQFFSW